MKEKINCKEEIFEFLEDIVDSNLDCNATCCNPSEKNCKIDRRKCLAERIENLINKHKFKRWRAEENEKYYFISSIGCEVLDIKDTNERLDTIRYNLGNYFKTKEEAVRKLRNLEIEQKLKDIALELNEGKEINWKHYNENKYNIQLDFNQWSEKMEISSNVTNLYKKQGTIYCLNPNFAKEAKKRIGTDELIDYLLNT